MLETALGNVKRFDRQRRLGPERLVAGVSNAADVARELERHFRENYPILLDGALARDSDQGRFIRQARESLARGSVDPGFLPAAVLRETLEAVSAPPRPTTRSGLTAIGPRHARVWWDDAVADDVVDILADLDKPQLVLRFYDVTGLGADAGRWHDTFDVDVAMGERGRSIELWASGRTYVVELGYRHSDGRFLCLARTNAAEIPRDGRADSEPEIVTVFSCLPPRAQSDRAAMAPDAGALEWTGGRRDHAGRDLEAELLIHMLYRSFLKEGPRALRRAPRPVRRDADILSREFAVRERSRSRQAAPKRIRKKKAPAVLVARLDPRRRDKPAAVPYAPIPAALAGGVARYAGAAQLSAERYALLLAAVNHVRSGRRFVYAPAAAPAVAGPSAEASRVSDLVTAVPIDSETDFTDSFLASPVFEAARALHRRLSGLSPLDAPGDREAVAEPAASRRREPAASRDFGGAEARRFAKAGVRITRMALTLEGRMRPGARLKVAGKLVHADADGRFSLECMLTGRKASIPLRAGTSIGGEACSLINVEWEKRAGREKKKVGV